MTDAATAPEEEAAPIVAVGRTILGAVLVLVGVAVLLAGAFWYFIVPWFGWATEGFWFQMAEWADLGGIAAMVLGFVSLVVGGALIQRARKKRFQVLIDASEITGSSVSAGEQPPAGGSAPPTIV